MPSIPRVSCKKRLVKRLRLCPSWQCEDLGIYCRLAIAHLERFHGSLQCSSSFDWHVGRIVKFAVEVPAITPARGRFDIEQFPTYIVLEDYSRRSGLIRLPDTLRFETSCFSVGRQELASRGDSSSPFFRRAGPDVYAIDGLQKWLRYSVRNQGGWASELSQLVNW